MSSGSLASEAWNARAVPWKLPRMLGGSPSACMVLSTVCTACPSETPGATSNESVTDGN
jgi:hypothetical protein